MSSLSGVWAGIQSLQRRGDLARSPPGVAPPPGVHKALRMKAITEAECYTLRSTQRIPPRPPAPAAGRRRVSFAENCTRQSRCMTKPWRRHNCNKLLSTVPAMRIRTVRTCSSSQIASVVDDLTHLSLSHRSSQLQPSLCAAGFGARCTACNFTSPTQLLRQGHCYLSSPANRPGGPPRCLLARNSAQSHPHNVISTCPQLLRLVAP
jgi:hypothetical protein